MLFSPKHYLKTFYFLLVGLFVAACAHAAVDNSTQRKGLLWKIESPVLSSESYLFGTIHSEDPRVTKIEGKVKQAFDSSQNFALEVELDAATPQVISQYLYFSDGQRLEPLLDPVLYQQTQQAMSKRGMPSEMVALMKPWAVFTVLNMPEAKTGEFLDALLYQNAKKQNKTIKGLESLEEQINVFDKMDLSTQIELLRSTLNNQANMDQILDETIEVYLSKDMENILALNNKYLKLLSPEVGEIFTQRLLIERNKRMVERLIPIIENGKTFIAVGALHLPGNEGIINQLTTRGYKLTPVD